MAFKRILCPIDFSPSSERAFALGAQLARESGGTLVLVHVFEQWPWTTGDYLLSPNILQDLVDNAQAELAKWRDRAKDLAIKDVQTRFFTGAPWDWIVREAQADTAIDLIVMGTHGRTGLKHVLLGSVAEKTVRHAPCAVLVARAREAS
ncbi:MAG: universal stress protein [Deltaproteobacteria bacterium]|nr:universal stress protein [Deltaproteobacteria bacterium]